jgi:hypothetical protein
MIMYYVTAHGYFRGIFYMPVAFMWPFQSPRFLHMCLLM